MLRCVVSGEGLDDRQTIDDQTPKQKQSRVNKAFKREECL